MLGRRDHSNEKKAVALLATCFVVGAGAATCLFIGLTSGDALWRPLLVAAGSFIGIVAFLWLLRDRDPRNQAAVRWGWLGRERPNKVEYHLSPRPRSQDLPVTPPAPPTAQSIRELGGGINTWVPTQSAPTHGKPVGPPKPPGR